uniref:Uncharacterized protein n=1 Tax=Eucampia antarctica TaxID=49252 RepID=A0A7S2R0M4_9STRA
MKTTTIMKITIAVALWAFSAVSSEEKCCDMEDKADICKSVELSVTDCLCCYSEFLEQLVVTNSQQHEVINPEDDSSYPCTCPESEDPPTASPCQ